MSMTMTTMTMTRDELLAQTADLVDRLIDAYALLRGDAIQLRTAHGATIDHTIEWLDGRLVMIRGRTLLAPPPPDPLSPAIFTADAHTIVAFTNDLGELRLLLDHDLRRRTTEAISRLTRGGFPGDREVTFTPGEGGSVVYRIFAGRPPSISRDGMVLPQAVAEVNAATLTKDERHALAAFVRDARSPQMAALLRDLSTPATPAPSAPPTDPGQAALERLGQFVLDL